MKGDVGMYYTKNRGNNNSRWQMIVQSCVTPPYILVQACASMLRGPKINDKDVSPASTKQNVCKSILYVCMLPGAHEGRRPEHTLGK